MQNYDTPQFPAAINLSVQRHDFTGKKQRLLELVKSHRAGGIGIKT